MTRALVIAHEPDGLPCQVGIRLQQRGYEVHVHFVTGDYEAPNDAVPFPSMTGYDLLVVMGSIRSLTNKEEINSWIYDELELVKQTHDAGTPILGVCFGGQVIAEALGGSVEEAPVTEIGWYALTDGENGPNPIGPGPWLQWHHDRFIPPPDAEVLARNESSIQLIRVDRTVGTQFHPEVDVGHIKGFLSLAPEDYLNEHEVDGDALLVETRQREAANIEQCHAFVDWFLDEVVAAD